VTKLILADSIAATKTLSVGTGTGQNILLHDRSKIKSQSQE
jgi:hypothetical protein